MTTFTIYLLRDGIGTAEDAVVDGAVKHSVSEGLIEHGSLFVKLLPSKPPRWAALFEDFIEKGNLGRVQSSAAAYFVSVENRLFALTFGLGRFIIRPDAIEERFGLLVTINSVRSDALRSIDKRDFVEEQNSRIQTSQATGAFDFGVDIERDLIRGIVGYPDSPLLGRRLAGADALTVNVDAKIPDLKRLLRRYLKAFQSKNYQVQFPWIDQVRQLRQKGQTAERLDALLVEKLKVAWANNGKVDGCWISIPDVVDWSVVRGFKYTSSRKEGVSSDLQLSGLVQAFPTADPTIEFLRGHYAMSVNEDEQAIDRWPAYRCIQCEVDDGGKSYILSAGHWFVVDADFVRNVVDFTNDIPVFDEPLPVFSHKDEGKYNEAVANASDGRWFLMDRKLLKVGGIHDRVEFCDLYGQGALLHVKKYGSSSVLGHLFGQGLVSGELLKGHDGYVALANEVLDEAHQLIDGKTPRVVTNYSVIFGVVSQSTKAGLHLPFFAKVVLKGVCTRLRELGYVVKLVKINCDQDFVLTKNVAAKKVRVAKRKCRIQV